MAPILDALKGFAAEALGRAGGLLRTKFLTPLIILGILNALKELPTDRFYAITAAAVILGLAYIVAEMKLDLERLFGKSNR